MSTEVVEGLRGLGADVPVSCGADAMARDLAGVIASADQLKRNVRVAFGHARMFTLASGIGERWDRLYGLCDAWDNADRIGELNEATRAVAAQLRACGKHMSELVGKHNAIDGGLRYAVAVLLIGAVQRAVARRVAELSDSQAT